MDAANRRQPVGVRAAAGNEPRPRRQRQVEALGGGEIPLHFHAVAFQQVENVALEVRRLGNVHRRAGGCHRLLPDPVFPGAEEFIEHVVLVARENQPADRQAHAARDVAGIYVAEIAGGNREGDLLGIGFRRGEVSLEVVHDLRRDPRPVDRIHRANAVARLEGGVGVHLLHHVLAVVEHALHRKVVDVRVLQAVHLRALEGAHAALRREHEDIDVFLAAHRVFGRRTGIARGGAQDVECFIFFLKCKFE